MTPQNWREILASRLQELDKVKAEIKIPVACRAGIPTGRAMNSLGNALGELPVVHQMVRSVSDFWFGCQLGAQLAREQRKQAEIKAKQEAAEQISNLIAESGLQVSQIINPQMA